jgi:hypothetical protein
MGAKAKAAQMGITAPRDAVPGLQRANLHSTRFPQSAITRVFRPLLSTRVSQAQARPFKRGRLEARKPSFALRGMQAADPER